MNIAIITAELPFPANSGGRIYTWERIKLLKEQGNNIYLYAFRNENELVEREKISEYCNSIKIYERNKNKMKIILNIYKPFSAYSRLSLKLIEDIKRDIECKNIDLIIVDMPQLAYNIPKNIKIPVICSQHNIEYKTFINVAKNTNNFMKKMAYLFEGIKLKYYEKNRYSEGIFDGYTFISDQDLKCFEELYNIKDTLLVPMGYDITKVKKELNENIIIFTGKMDYYPNVESVKWFCKEVFPHIKNEIKDSMFYIVGKNPTEEVMELDKIDGVNVTGAVDDINKYIDIAKLVVIPLLSGGGVKIKLLEALGRNNIVVSTNKGIEGTEFLDREHVIVANNKEDFSKYCIDVLRNPNKYNNLPNEAIKLIEEKYSWNNIGKKYNNFLKEKIYKRLV